MTKPQHSPQFLRKRKMMLILPLLVLPFVCIVFVALGGGKGTGKNTTAAAGSHGFNMTLPTAHFAKKETALNKLAFYEKADEDSAKLLERMKQDPYHLKLGMPAPAKLLPEGQAFLGMGGNGSDHFINHLSAVRGEDSNANKLLRQLDALKQVLHRPAVPEVPAGVVPSVPGASGPPVASSAPPDANQLEKLMEKIKAADTASSDPKLEKLSGMLDKIIRIQHPGQELPGDKSPSTAQAPAALTVTPFRQPAAVSSLAANLSGEVDSGGYEETEGFYSIDEAEKIGPTVENTMSAVI